MESTGSDRSGRLDPVEGSVASTTAAGAGAPIRILLVDDHAIMRVGTRRILEGEPDLQVVGEAADGLEAIARAEETQPDVVVLDLSMPEVDGLTASSELRCVAPRARLLILSAHARRAYVRALSRLGIEGYLLKSAAASELIAAIRRVHAGERVFDPALKDQLSGTASVPHEPSDRELDVLRVLAQGYTNRGIAQALCLSENTVEFHLRNLYRKLEANSRADAIVHAQRLGWLDSPEPLC